MRLEAFLNSKEIERLKAGEKITRNSFEFELIVVLDDKPPPTSKQIVRANKEWEESFRALQDLQQVSQDKEQDWRIAQAATEKARRAADKSFGALMTMKHRMKEAK